jgi:hypothetical protein
MSKKVYLIEKTLNNKHYFLKKISFHANHNERNDAANTMTWTKNIKAACILYNDDDVIFF